MPDMQTSTAPTITTTQIRERNLSDRRRDAAITLTMEHLDVYAAVVITNPAKAASKAFRRQVAIRILDGAASQLRGQ